MWNTTTVEAYGNEKGMLGGLKIQDVKTKEVRDLPVSGLFFAIGHEPASKFLNNQVCSLYLLGFCVAMQNVGTKFT